jgi:uncharacterized membrane protein YoaT (DUF817 family)
MLFHLSLQTFFPLNTRKILKEAKYFLRQIVFSCSQFLAQCYVLLMILPNNLCQAASRLPRYDFLTTVFLAIQAAWDIGLTV